MNFFRHSIIDHALEEDIGTGDITTESIVPKNVTAIGLITSKEAGIVAGLWIVREIFKKAKVVFHVRDGEKIRAHQTIALVSGNARYILSRERVALNFLRHLSGIATEANKYVHAVKNKAIILDTRKTTPGLRKEEKYAVRLGGAQNHRFGLYDMVLIKDNHLKIAGSIMKAVQRAKRSNKKIEVEIEHLSQLEEAMEAKPDLIMLDNMSLGDMKKAVTMVGKKIPLEASGNVTLKNVLKIAQTGVDYISVGAITHSAQALDISMDFQ